MRAGAAPLTLVSLDRPKTGSAPIMKCPVCSKRDVTETVQIGAGSYSSTTQGLTGDMTRYEGRILSLGVCRRCYIRYHLHDTITKMTLTLIFVTAIGFAVWGLAHKDIGVFGGFFIGLIAGAIFWFPIGLLLSKLIRSMFSPESYLKAHPEQPTLQDGFSAVFYVDKKGVVETKSE